MGAAKSSARRGIGPIRRWGSRADCLDGGPDLGETVSHTGEGPPGPASALVQAGAGLRLELEAMPPLVAGVLSQDHLQRDPGPVGPAAFVDDTHAAAPDLTDDLVDADLLWPRVLHRLVVYDAARGETVRGGLGLCRGGREQFG